MAISTRKAEARAEDGPMKAIEDVTKVIDEVPQGVDYKKLFADEAFMNEMVEIMLMPGADISEVAVPVAVNGNRILLIPGRPTLVRRLYIAQLLKARPDTVIHRTDDERMPEAQRNRIFKRSTSRYNFDILKDTQKGIAWFRELQTHHFQK